MPRPSGSEYRPDNYYQRTTKFDDTHPNNTSSNNYPPNKRPANYAQTSITYLPDNHRSSRPDNPHPANTRSRNQHHPNTRPGSYNQRPTRSDDTKTRDNDEIYQPKTRDDDINERSTKPDRTSARDNIPTDNDRPKAGAEYCNQHFMRPEEANPRSARTADQDWSEFKNQESSKNDDRNRRQSEAPRNGTPLASLLRELYALDISKSIILEYHQKFRKLCRNNDFEAVDKSSIIAIYKLKIAFAFRNGEGPESTRSDDAGRKTIRRVGAQK